MKPRNGHKVKVIKKNKVVAICENIGEATRLTKVCGGTIRKRLKDGLATNGYRFKEAVDG